MGEGGVGAGVGVGEGAGAGVGTGVGGEGVGGVEVESVLERPQCQTPKPTPMIAMTTSAMTKSIVFLLGVKRTGGVL